jgi:hypothetical protein
VALGIFFVLALAIALVPEIFFLLNLQETLRRVSPQNRAMPAGYVWLQLIPVFGIGWFIYTVIKVTDSLRAEYGSRGWRPEGDFGYGVGLAAGILNIAGFVWEWIPGRVLPLGVALGIGQLVCWIIYWVKTARIKNRLGPVLLGPGWVRPHSGYVQPPGPGVWPGWSVPPAGGEPPAAGSEDQARRCAACGTAVAPGDRFCWNCGSPQD